MSNFPLNRFNALSGKCGKPVERLAFNLWFSCVLERGHTGECQRGGICHVHGPYIGSECRHWPRCISESRFHGPETR